MNIIDALKKSVLEQLDTNLTVGGVLLSLVTAAIISLIVIAVYKKTYSGVVYQKSTALTILLLTLATSMIIRTINSNLSLSLGMVGALSIVRFRTAIKDPVDTAFLFWGVTGGIMAGAGLYFIGLVGSLGIALIFYVAYLFNIKSRAQYLLVFSYDMESEVFVESLLDTLEDKQLKSKAIDGGFAEVTYQVCAGENLNGFMAALRGVECIKNVNLVSYANDMGL